MVNFLKDFDWKKTGIFAAGVAFGTAGIKVLSSKDAKKFYTNCTAAALRAKECVMKTVSTVQENALHRQRQQNLKMLRQQQKQKNKSLKIAGEHL